MDRPILERLLGLHVRRALKVLVASRAEPTRDNTMRAIRRATLDDAALGNRSLFALYERFIQRDDTLPENTTWALAMRGDDEPAGPATCDGWDTADDEFDAAWVRGDPFVRLVQGALIKCTGSRPTGPAG